MSARSSLSRRVARKAASVGSGCEEMASTSACAAGRGRSVAAAASGATTAARWRARGQPRWGGAGASRARARRGTAAVAQPGGVGPISSAPSGGWACLGTAPGRWPPCRRPHYWWMSGVKGEHEMVRSQQPRTWGARPNHPGDYSRLSATHVLVYLDQGGWGGWGREKGEIEAWAWARPSAFPSLHHARRVTRSRRLRERGERDGGMRRREESARVSGWERVRGRKGSEDGSTGESRRWSMGRPKPSWSMGCTKNLAQNACTFVVLSCKKLSTILSSKGDIEQLISVGSDLTIRTLMLNNIVLVAKLARFNLCGRDIIFFAGQWEGVAEPERGRTIRGRTSERQTTLRALISSRDFLFFYFVFPISNSKPSLNLFWILNTS